MQAVAQDGQRLAGKVALVLGGSRGIGAAIVRRLAGDGAAVAFTHVNPLPPTDAPGLAILADSADPAAVAAAVAQTVARFGRLDILVVNAGIFIRCGIAEYRLEDFDRMLVVNVRGVFVAVQAALPHLGAGGRIVTIGSNVADRTAFPGSSVYAMTKGAVASFVRGAARDLAPRGITVNNVQPGPIATDMTATVAARVTPLVPVGRMGEPDEVAALVAYLAGDEAGFVTGASLTIDGGYGT
jgi:3-oxoacyl-[acyl-carrier protein] reductase